MSKKLMVVLTNPVAGRDKEYNDWYTNTHVPDVLKVPGFETGQRFKVMDAGEENRPYGYLAIYEINTDDPHALMDALYGAGKDMVISDALDQEDMGLWIFSPITPRMVAK